MNVEISNIIICITFLLIFVLSTNNNYSGTLVATVITQNRIFLFSDGIITDHRTDKVASEEVSKVHKISNRVGLLSVGVFIYNLDTQIQNYGHEKDLNNVVVVTDIVRRVLKEEWGKRKLTKDRRMFVFVVGYEGDNTPRLFYIDSNNGFSIEERKLLLNENGMDIGIMAHDSDIIPNSTEVFTSYIKSEININPTNINECLLKAFTSLVQDYNKIDNHIGGKIHHLVLNP